MHGIIGGASVRWNPYSYVGGNPINNVDPDGCIAISTAVVGAIALRFAIGFVSDAAMQYLTNCGQVDWGQASISGGISVATGGLDKIGKLGRVGKFAVETALEASAFTLYDRARGRNTNFFGNVADSAIGNVIGEGIGRGVGAGLRGVRGALSSYKLNFNAVTMGGFPVLQKKDWVDDLIQNRRVTRPGGVKTEQAAWAVWDRLNKMGYNYDYLKKKSLSILSVGDRFYLGFNKDLDGNLLGFANDINVRMTTSQKRYYTATRELLPDFQGHRSLHAETMALQELYIDILSGNRPNGTVGRMFTTREVCGTFCLIGTTSGTDGQILAGLQATGLKRLDMYMRLNDFQTQDPARFTHFSRDGRAKVVATPNKWWAVNLKG